MRTTGLCFARYSVPSGYLSQSTSHAQLADYYPTPTSRGAHRPRESTDALEELAAIVAMLAAVRPAWHADAACKEHPELDWFPPKGVTHRRLVEVCRGCLVREECAAFAVPRRELHGVWGGLSEKTRRELRRERRQPETAA